MPQNKTTKFMEGVIFSLYNYASNRREAYLLLQLFRTALQEEIKYALLTPVWGTGKVGQRWQLLLHT
jgi:Ras GTPase-activating-like protein IQGAP2/3